MTIVLTLIIIAALIFARLAHGPEKQVQDDLESQLLDHLQQAIALTEQCQLRTLQVPMDEPAMRENRHYSQLHLDLQKIIERQTNFYDHPH